MKMLRTTTPGLMLLLRSLQAEQTLVTVSREQSLLEISPINTNQMCYMSTYTAVDTTIET